MDDKKWYHCADEWFQEGYINEVLQEAATKAGDEQYIQTLIAKAETGKGLTHQEAAVLLQVKDTEFLAQIGAAAKRVKETIYGKRVVLFAPLYISDYCVNDCAYCGYKISNKEHNRRKLTLDEVEEEVIALEKMGHKRLALELGENDQVAPITYVLDVLKRIYAIKCDNGQIRRVNVNIAATTIAHYKQLKEADIGTYVLFQETYHKPTYEKVHPKGPKHNYSYHTTAFHRAMLGGIDDVGAGVLYGLYDYKFETIAMLMHAERLEKEMGVGPHTMSVPRLRKAENVTLENYPYLVDDEQFKQVVMVLRLAVPYTGLIMSTREDEGLRKEMLELGISQMSAGSSTAVGGYKAHDVSPQFEVGDHRSPLEVIKSLLKDGYIPSYCTACYRQGRTGERFMRLAKSGRIGNICTPNALMTLSEYLEDYGDDEAKALGKQVVAQEIQLIEHEKVREQTAHYVQAISNGKRDFRF